MMRHFNLEIRCPSGAPLIGGWSSTPPGANAGCALDHDRFPTIPATALRGALRETLEALIRGNDGDSLKVLVCSGGDGVDPRKDKGSSVPVACLLDSGRPCIVCRIFGGPNQLPMLILHDGKYAADGSGRPTSYLRNGVAIDRTTRTAKGNLLFTYELTGPGTEQLFVAEGHLRQPSAEDLQEPLSLLRAASIATTHIGRGRSRGFGRVDIRFVDVEQAPPCAVSIPLGTTTSLRFIAKLDAPASVAFFPAAAFVRDTRDDIPGSTVRGALGFALADAGLDKDPAFGELFEGSARATFDFAYPVDDLKSTDTVGPWPLTARHCKVSANHRVFDTLLDQIAVRLRKGERGPAERLSRRLPASCPHKNCGAPTDRPDGYRRLEAPVRRRVITRVAINRTTSSARDEALYSQVLLDSGTYFEGTIRNISPSALDFLRRGLSLPLSFGRGRARGWGRASLIQVRENCAATASDLLERAEGFSAHLSKHLASVGLEGLDGRCRALVPITVLSPMLLPAAGPQDDDGTAILEQQLSIPNVRWLHKAARFGFEGGWDARAGEKGAIPAANSTLGGSVFVLDLGDRDWKDVIANLVQLENRGVGDRTHQGFGRILCFDPFIGRKA